MTNVDALAVNFHRPNYVNANRVRGSERFTMDLAIGKNDTGSDVTDGVATKKWGSCNLVEIMSNYHRPSRRQIMNQSSDNELPTKEPIWEFPITSEQLEKLESLFPDVVKQFASDKSFWENFLKDSGPMGDIWNDSTGVFLNIRTMQLTSNPNNRGTAEDKAWLMANPRLLPGHEEIVAWEKEQERLRNMEPVTLPPPIWVGHRTFISVNSFIGNELSTLLDYAAGKTKFLYVPGLNKYNGNERFTQNVLDALKKIGIDTSKDFTLNGTTFTVRNGIVDKKSVFEAQDAAAQQRIHNKTSYTNADQHTKSRIHHMTEYHFRDAPPEVKQAFYDMMEKTGFSPFGDGLRGTLRTISQEQDFATFGDDNVIGSTKASAVAGFLRIINRVAELTKEREENIRNTEEQIKVAQADLKNTSNRSKSELEKLEYEVNRLKSELEDYKYELNLMKQEDVFYRALIAELM